ncbi:MAG TPA: T9SS type A sorting domain-containing protein [Chitinophagales bacterium]|nr:T9SS type A sorting domain-containing protein [Chitinophagales bacterium]
MLTTFELKVLQPIIQPCTANPTEMLAHDLGQYCLDCNKVVHELTHLDNTALINYLTQPGNENICGKIDTAALAPQITLNITKQSNEQRRLYTFGIALLFVFGPLLFSCNDVEHEVIKENIISTYVAPEIEEEAIEEITIDLPNAEDITSQQSVIQELPITPNTDTAEITLEPVIVAGKTSDKTNGLIVGELELICAVKRVLIKIDTTPLATPEIITSPINRELTLGVYPNPAMSNVTIAYEITEPGSAVLSIFNINGQHITDLLNTNDISTGNFTTAYNVDHLASGMYLVILVNNDKKEVFRMMVGR